MKEDRLDAPVRDCMVSAVRTLSQEQSLTAAARELEQLGMSALPVVERSGRLTGLLGWAELRGAGRLLSRAEEPRGQLRLPEGTVAQFMSSSVPVISREASIALAARRMYERGLKRLYVAEDGPLEGVLSTRELLRVVQSLELALPLGRFARRAVATIDASEPLAAAAALWSAEPQHGARRLSEAPHGSRRNAEPLNLVVLRDGVAVGVLTPETASLSREADPQERVERWMDRDLLSLPPELSASGGAQQLLEQDRRYIVTRGPAGVLGLLSGLDFAKLIADSATRSDALDS
ncbi:MAG: hypothetical protein RL033_2593 [Pseudomonadota bacterium]